jgi:hypothetical protein
MAEKSKEKTRVKAVDTRPEEPERHSTGDESRESRLRAAGRFESDAEETQLEEDFGERGLHTPGGVHDVRHNPSILEPTTPED